MKGQLQSVITDTMECLLPNRVKYMSLRQRILRIAISHNKKKSHKNIVYVVNRAHVHETNFFALSLFENITKTSGRSRIS